MLQKKNKQDDFIYMQNYYFDPTQRDKDHVSRSDYTGDFFADVMEEANSLNETKYIEGNFYDSELRSILKRFSLAPSSKIFGKIPKTHYCHFDINPSATE